MTIALPPWTHLRPWRNQNPGDLRTLPAPQHWTGQVSVDHSPGGPFAIFDSRTSGWRALAVCLLTYYHSHGLDTVETIIGRYAPALENDTNSYIQLVCSQLKIGPADRIDPTKQETMMDLVSAIALAEGGARMQWPETEKLVGVRLALDLPKSIAPSVVLPVRTQTVSADDLNQQVLDGTFVPPKETPDESA